MDPITRRSDVHGKGADGLCVLHPFEPADDVRLQSVTLTVTAAQLWAEMPAG